MKKLFIINFIFFSVLYADDCITKILENEKKKIENFNIIKEVICTDSQSNLINGIFIIAENKKSLKKFNRIKFFYFSEKDYKANLPTSKTYLYHKSKYNETKIKVLSYFDNDKKNLLTDYSDEHLTKSYFLTSHFNKEKIKFKKQLSFLSKKENGKVIHSKSYFITGELKHETDYKKGLKKGFYLNGALKYIWKNSISGMKSETYKEFFPNGNLKLEIDNSWIRFKDGITYTEYYSNGKIKQKMLYINKIYKTSFFDKTSNLVKEVFHKNPSLDLDINRNANNFNHIIMKDCIKGFSYKGNKKKLNEAQLYSLGCR